MRRSWFFNLLALAVFVGTIVGSTAPASAQAGDVGTPVKVCIAPAKAGQTASDYFSGKATVDCSTPQTAFGAGDFWVLSGPVHMGPRDLIRSTSLWQERMTVYARYADGAVVAIPVDGRQASRDLQLGAIFSTTPPDRGVPVTRLLWHVEGAGNLRGVVLAPRIASLRQSGWSNLQMSAIYAAFTGLCIALLVYNLALWSALRHDFQLAYCAMVLALLLYAFTSSGAIAWVWHGMLNNDRIRINYLALGLSSTAALTFARSFFEPRVFAGWIGRAANIMSVTLIGAAVLVAVMAPWHLMVFDRLYLIAFLALVALVPPVLVRAWRQRSKYLWLFAIAWAAPIVFAGVRVANNLGLMPWNFWIDNSTILSMTAEALLSSTAIAYRIRLLSIERDEARAQEIAARLLADTDPLTGLLNRRSFLRHAIGREGEQLLFVIDIDHFKRVNETIGHDGGDEVLRVVARTLRQSVSPEALLARIGGEEFAIIVSADRIADADEEAESILARFRAERMPFDLSVTASIGMCRGPLVREIDWKKLYRGADMALFEAKAAGRDRARGKVLDGYAVAA